jgi:hypothetical protein
MSHVPYFANLFDLLRIPSWKRLPRASDRIDRWTRRTGLKFPAVMREFYSTAVALPLGGSEPRFWKSSLRRLWSDYGNMEPARTLPQVLQVTDRPRRADEVRGPFEPGPYSWIMTENQGCWLMEVQFDGSDDPPVYAEAVNILSPGDWSQREEKEWHTVGRFSELIFAWFAYYYREKDWVPLRFSEYTMQPRRTSDLRHFMPPRPYRSGLWLRAARVPFVPPAIDYLIERFGEPERKRHGNRVTTYAFRTEAGLIRVTADAPDADDGRAAWWLFSEDADGLKQLAELVGPFGGLWESLTADTDAGRTVLRTLHG